MHQGWRKSLDGNVHFCCYFVVCQWKAHDKGRLCRMPSKGTRQSVMADDCARDSSDARSHLSAICHVFFRQTHDKVWRPSAVRTTVYYLGPPVNALPCAYGTAHGKVDTLLCARVRHTAKPNGLGPTMRTVPVRRRWPTFAMCQTYGTRQRFTLAVCQLPGTRQICSLSCAYSFAHDNEHVCRVLEILHMANILTQGKLPIFRSDII